ncbi:GldG family protein [Acetivibrio mesophilus]|uniref:ABC transporter n=1 Tax=Acetivibrio mesophilus TaxID=2487273 RepID=A0A4Q0I565_9FIRM|nr:GldG family protein [Acetivibrio mesophilus]ODM27504.1 ABC transporter [Clostridium sp. Bc-iso-3]RXE59463.1 ABC transporter [Acetivibrio mesophilus]HHV30254.1 GldG family protein [Clostridium sp.]
MKKNLKYSIVFFVMAVLVVGITILLNVFASNLDIRWDVSQNKMYSIGEQTEIILEGLKQEVDVVMLADREGIKSYEAGFIIVEFLDKYSKFDKVNVSFIDPDKNPDIVKDLNKSGTLNPVENEIIVRSGDKVKKITLYDIFQQDYYGPVMFMGEQAVTGAIKYVTSETTPTVYFVDAHSTKKLESEYNYLKKTLEYNNYEVKKLDLTRQEKVPEDTSILFFAPPTQDLSAEERDRVIDYLKGGGNAIFLFDPSNSDEKLDNFDKVLNEYSMALNYDKIKENNVQAHVANRPYHIIPQVMETDITNEQDLSQFAVIMPESRSIRSLINDKEPLTVTPLLSTSSDAVGEPFGGGATEKNQGPVDVALVAEYVSAVTSKIVVIGNGSFLTDEVYETYYPYSSNNLHLIGLTSDWMQDKSNDVFIVAKTSVTDTINLSGLNAALVIAVAVLAFPIIITSLGIIIWLRRRHL